MAYTAVGSPKTGEWSSSNIITVGSVNPTATKDVLVVWASTWLSGTTVTVTSVSHPGVTTWHQLVGKADSSNHEDAEIWWGVVTATGSGTLDVNLSGTPSSGGVEVQQFNSSVSGTWTADTVTAASTWSGTSGNYPSMTPTSAGELQLACGGRDAVLTRVWGGSTSGYTYGGIDPMQSLYNLSGPSSSAPAWTLTATAPVALVQGALYVVPSNAPGAGRAPQQAVNRAATYAKRVSGLWTRERGLIVPDLRLAMA